MNNMSDSEYIKLIQVRDVQKTYKGGGRDSEGKITLIKKVGQALYLYQDGVLKMAL